MPGPADSTRAPAWLVRAQVLLTTLTFTGAPVVITAELNVGFDLR